MPALPFATPTTDFEHWANILHDLGANPYTSTSPDRTTWHGILLALDNGLFQTGTNNFGSGIDGTQTFDGTSTITLWNGTTLAPSTGVYTLTQDLWLGNGSAINSGVTIKTAGFRIFCQGDLTNNGTIQSNGNAASANTAGALLTYSGTLGATTVGTAGGAGSTTANNGVNGAANGLGGAGGVGGTGAGPQAGGTGGTVTAPIATVQLPFSTPLATMGRLQLTTAFASIIGGSGGGSGGGDGTNLSGGGGGGGGVVVVCAQRISGTGNVQANGGAGGNANATGNSGGGAGGGGGVVIVVSRVVQPKSVNSSGPLVTNQTITAAGGVGGAGTGTGAAGGAGVAGTAVLVPA